MQEYYLRVFLGTLVTHTESNFLHMSYQLLDILRLPGN